MRRCLRVAVLGLGALLLQARASHGISDGATATAAPASPATATTAPTGPYPADSPDWARARANYLLHCMGCHRADGIGTANRIPALRDRVGYYLGFAEGRDYLLHVPGALNAPISSHDLASVMNWVIAEFGGRSNPNDWTAITADEVARARSLRPVDIDALRVRVWAAVAAAHPGSSPY
ncbi:MAG: c-type cytochrome [Gammaproteobacteria bacterium]